MTIGNDYNHNKFYKKNLLQFKYYLLFLLLLNLSSVCLTIYFPLLLGKMSNFIASNKISSFRDIEGINILIILIFAQFFIQFLSHMFNNLFNYKFITYWYSKLINILDMNYDSWVKKSAGYYTSRLLEDVDSCYFMFSSVFFDLLNSVLLTILSIYFLYTILPTIVWFLIVIAIIILTISNVIQKYNQKKIGEIVEKQAELKGITTEVISGYMMGHGFSVIEKLKSFFMKRAIGFRKLELLNKTKIGFLLHLIILLPTILFLSAILLLDQSGADFIKINIIISSLFYINIFKNNVMDISNYLSDYHFTSIHISRIIEVLNMRKRKNKVLSNVNVEQLLIKNLSYHYPNKKVFDDISIELKSGDILAVTGGSGIGKTTFIKTIFGFLDKKKGEIIINNKIKIHKLNQLGSKVIYIPQDLILFSGKLRENIFLLQNHYDKKKNDNKIKNIMLKLKIKNLSQNNDFLNLDIHEGGKNISGGERQRVVFLSLLLNNPDIIILDEITSQVDSIAEETIQNFILELVEKGKIIIFVAHKSKLLDIATKIIDFDKLK